MEDKDKTKKQLIEELGKLRQISSRFEKSKEDWKQDKKKHLIINERLDFLISTSPAAIYTAKISGDYGATYISDSVKAITGYEPKEFVEKSSFWINHIHPEDVDHILSEAQKIFEKECISYQYRFKCRNGEYTWIQDELKLVRDEEGKPQELIGYWADISERKKIEEQLQLHSDIMMNLSEGINLVQSSNGILLYTNPQFEKMFGYGPDELVGKHVSVLNASPDNRGKEQVKEILNSLERKNKWKGEIENIKKDGTVFFSYASIIKSKHHEFGDVFISAQIDISELKNVGNELRKSEWKYRSLIESTDDLIYLVDKNYSYIFMNKKHLARFNLPLGKIIGKPYSEFHSKKQIEIFKKDVNKVIRTGRSITHEHKSERDDKFYLRTYSPVKNDEGGVIAVNVISKDISGLKQVENQLK